MAELAVGLFFYCHPESQVACRERVFSFPINDYLEGFCVLVRKLGDAYYVSVKEKSSAFRPGCDRDLD